MMSRRYGKTGATDFPADAGVAGIGGRCAASKRDLDEAAD